MNKLLSKNEADLKGINKVLKDDRKKKSNCNLRKRKEEFGEPSPH